MHALVIGASGDIGMAICYRLAKEGWSLYCHYHTQKQKTLSFVSDLQKRYPQQDFFMLSLDMNRPEHIPDFTARLFHVDAVIFAAGDTSYRLLPEMSSERIDQLWNVHVRTPILLLQQLQDKLAQAEYGRVVFIGSVYGHRGSSMESVYSAVKGAQEGFAKAYAKEVASLKITVNVVAPGAVMTRMNQNWSALELAELTAAIPLRRLAVPEEIAAACNYFVSKEASYTTGVILPVAGGWLE